MCKGKADQVYIASDGDREGEAIAHDLISILGLSTSRTKRITFREISKVAILSAIENPGRLNMNAYNAQQARRIIDIIYGYSVSPLLWKYVENRLSAGRCQSPAVKLIVDRQGESENLALDTKKINIVCDVFDNDPIQFFPIHLSEKITAHLTEEYSSVGEEAVVSWLDEQINKKQTVLLSQKVKVRLEKPQKTLTTSALQQVVYNAHGIHPKECMQIAQKLYEGGYISYHRTDSTEVSDEFKKSAERFVEEKYGTLYARPKNQEPGGDSKKRSGKSESIAKRKLKKDVPEQAAHEGIRPISIRKFPEGKGLEYKVYMKIWLYAIGSQMSDAVFNDTQFSFGDEETDVPIWGKKVATLKFEGHLKLFGREVCEDENEGNFRNMNIGNIFTIKGIRAKEYVESPPKPFSPAGLIKMLEKTGIGRPSTYSTIVSKIVSRGYVQLGTSKSTAIQLNVWDYNHSERNASIYEQKIGGHKGIYVATELGGKVTSLLEEVCNYLIQPSFTQEMESNLDLIAQGKLVWTNVVADFYKKMKESLLCIPKNISKKEDMSRTMCNIPWVRRYTFKTDQENNLEIGEIKGRYGIVAAKALEGKIVKFSPLPPSTKLSDFTDEEIKNIFNYPKKYGTFNEKDMILCLGKKGWYLEIMNGNSVKEKIHVSNEKHPPSKLTISKILDKL
jgi:DNA topoisomerase-1